MSFYKAFGFTPAALPVSEIAIGGTAIHAIVGPINGAFITNPPDAISQGIATAENIYIDMVAEPGATDTTGNGTTSIITPGNTYTIPSLAAGVIVYVNAATTGHKLTGTVW